MRIQPIDYFLVAWFALVAASTLYVGLDQYRNNPEPLVMRWGFILVTLYMGPIGLLLYVHPDKKRLPIRAHPHVPRICPRDRMGHVTFLSSFPPRPLTLTRCQTLHKQALVGAT